MTALTPQQDERQRFAVSGSVEIEDGMVRLNWSDEAGIRRGLARVAFACGWDVEEEVVIPGWGRIDLVLSDRTPGSILIELKVDLSKPSDVRRGFQQADGYGRWWTSNRHEPAAVYLVAARSVADLIAPVAVAYPEVAFLPCTQVIARLASWGDPRARIGIAQQRADSLSSLLEVHDYAVKKLGGGS